MLSQRVRSPLRWLWVMTSALAMLVVAGATGFPWLIAAMPVVCAAILLVPPLGVFQHDETPPPRTGVSLEVRASQPVPTDPPGARRFLLSLRNDGDVTAEGFRIRILLPAAIWPRGTRGSPLGVLHTGTLGTHWFTESVYDDTSLTFRAGDPGDPGAIACRPGEAIDLADLVLVNLAYFEQGEIEYQINGGTVRAVLGRLVPTQAS